MEPPARTPTSASCRTAAGHQIGSPLGRVRTGAARAADETFVDVEDVDTASSAGPLGQCARRRRSAHLAGWRVIEGEQGSVRTCSGSVHVLFPAMLTSGCCRSAMGVGSSRSGRRHAAPRPHDPRPLRPVLVRVRSARRTRWITTPFRRRFRLVNFGKVLLPQRQVAPMIGPWSSRRRCRRSPRACARSAPGPG